MKQEAFCPVTGLRVLALPEWTNIQAGDSFSVSFSVVGKSIIYSRPCGHSDIEGVRKSLTFNNSVAEKVSSGTGPYVQIEDYADLAGSTQASRRYFARNMDANNRLLALIFCNLSPALAMAVKIGIRLKISPKQIHVVRDYSEAIGLAAYICAQNNLNDDAYALDQPVCFDKSLRCLSPVELLVDDTLDVNTPEFSNRSVLIDGCILSSTTRGRLESNHIPGIDHMRSGYQSALSGGAAIQYIVVDGRRLTGGSRQARFKYMQSLKNRHRQYPIRMYIVYGSNLFMQTALHLARPLMPFKVKTATDLNHAFELIKHDRQGNPVSRKTPDRNLDQPPPTQKDIDNLTAFISSINWEKESIEAGIEVDEGHPFYFLYQSIQLIKEELDGLMAERQQLNQQLVQSRKIDALGRMAGAIAHNFNNQLAVVTGNLELAMEDMPENSELHDKLKQAMAAARRSADISGQMLTYLGHSRVRLENLDLSAICRENQSRLREEVHENIALKIDFMPSGPVIHGNANQMRQVLANLVTNAAEAIKDDPGTITLATDVIPASDIPASQLWPADWTPDADNFSCLEVSDTGEGMTRKTMDALFDPFFSTRFAGRGLGLAVVLGIIKSWNGAISVESRPDSGTTFRIFLPQVMETPSLPAERKDTSHDVLSSGTVLVVDDQEDVRKMANAMLVHLGYAVLTAADGKEAVDVFQQNQDDIFLVISDLSMPVIDGWETLAALRKIRPYLPVILASGYDENQAMTGTHDQQPNAFLHKPYLKDDLKNALAEALGNKPEK